ncbi:MAG: glycosyltransferase family 4 protein [Anaerolineae bacterium]|nr:glycosyltransferase family 4 protein [Anaerolineae bacterium]
MLTEFASRLVARGHDVTLPVAQAEGSAAPFPLDERVRIVYRGSGSGMAAPMYRLLSALGPEYDTVVANYYPTAYAAALWGLGHGKPAHYLVQGYEPGFIAIDPQRRCRHAKAALAALSYRLPLRIIAVSTWLGAAISRAGGRPRAIVSAGVDTIRFSGEHDSPDRESRLVMVLARREPWKGLDVLLRGLRSVPGDCAGLRLLAVTQDPTLRLDTDVPVEYCYPRDDLELAACYRRASVFVFPSLMEGFGLPPLEAMACGAPVVVADCGGVRDFAVHGKNAIVVQPGDSEGLMAGVFRVLGDPRLAAELARDGKLTARHMDWERATDRLERVLTGQQVGSEFQGRGLCS